MIIGVAPDKMYKHKPRVGNARNWVRQVVKFLHEQPPGKSDTTSAWKLVAWFSREVTTADGPEKFLSLTGLATVTLAAPMPYKVNDLAGQMTVGIFYDLELIKSISLTGTKWILKQQTDWRSVKKNFHVKWLGQRFVFSEATRDMYITPFFYQTWLSENTLTTPMKFMWQFCPNLCAYFKTTTR